MQTETEGGATIRSRGGLSVIDVAPTLEREIRAAVERAEARFLADGGDVARLRVALERAVAGSSARVVG